ncbi:hypothetical protein [Paraburkholderia hospita]|uniref:hypothetical protein n=1 Tax=Paraburkholderia hospita TaxID=169430 RepID=UPI0013F15588|nr:hypothetical protein [Paraburkholderia hospita]
MQSTVTSPHYRTDNRNLTEQISNSLEAVAVARIASAAREVQAISTAMEKHFDAIRAPQPSSSCIEAASRANLRMAQATPTRQAI